MPPQLSKQESFASNLKGSSLGVALYSPLSFGHVRLSSSTGEECAVDTSGSPDLCSGRVGDIAFFHQDGKYQWVRNAFDRQGLQQWNWPEFMESELTAVAEETPGHFRIAIGGQFCFSNIETGADVSVPVPPSVQVGGNFKVRVSRSNTSMSILVPDKGPLLHRACLNTQYFNLLDWFAAVEMHAWTAVNSYFGPSRPAKILLVTGQTLTPAYSITHKQQTTSDCEIHLEADSGIPAFVEGNILLGYTLKSAAASIGFENNSPGPTAGKLYSVFLETYESYPLNIIKSRRLVSRLQGMYNFFTRFAGKKPPVSGLNGFQSVKWPGHEMKPERVTGGPGTTNKYQLIKYGEEFALQYTGPDTETEFPLDLDDDAMMPIIETIFKSLVGAEAFSRWEQVEIQLEQKQGEGPLASSQAGETSPGKTASPADQTNMDETGMFSSSWFPRLRPDTPEAALEAFLGQDPESSLAETVTWFDATFQGPPRFEVVRDFDKTLDFLHARSVKLDTEAITDQEHTYRAAISQEIGDKLVRSTPMSDSIASSMTSGIKIKNRESWEKSVVCGNFVADNHEIEDSGKCLTRQTLWDSTSGRLVWERIISQTSCPMSSFSAAGRYLAVSDGMTVDVIECETGRDIVSVKLNQSERRRAIAVAPEGDRLAVSEEADYWHSARPSFALRCDRLPDEKNGGLSRSVDVVRVCQPSWQTQQLSYVANGARLFFIGGSALGEVHAICWDVLSGVTLGRYDLSDTKPHIDAPIDVVQLPGNTAVVVRLWQSLAGSKGFIRLVVFSSDARTIGDYDDDGILTHGVLRDKLYIVYRDRRIWLWDLGNQSKPRPVGQVTSETLIISYRTSLIVNDNKFVLLEDVAKRDESQRSRKIVLHPNPRMSSKPRLAVGTRLKSTSEHSNLQEKPRKGIPATPAVSEDVEMLR